MADVQFTWLGHGSYRFDSPGGKRIYVDPWLENPKCPDGERSPERVDVMVISHGHGDHVGSAVDVGKQHAPAVVAIFELANWLESQGVENASALGMVGCRRCIPVHWGTFPALTGTPDQLREHASGVEVLAPEPGETITI